MTHILVLGTADWDQAIATNQHYAVRELARENDVTFVQSMGLRKVELTPRDLKRMARRLRHLASPSRHPAANRAVPDRVRVVSPRVFPLHSGVSERINRISLAHQFQQWSSSTQPKVLWLYSPLEYGLARHADLVVYHCVDLLATFPGIDGELFDKAERRLSSFGHVVATGSSPAVVAHLSSAGFENPLSWPNVADTSIFVDAVARSRRERRTAAVFAGNMTETKVDFDLLEAVVNAGIELHLAGPIAEGGGDARSRVERLISNGATYHGLLSLPALAKLQASCSVGLIPYVSNEYTAGVSPLKTFEYLASGLSVVSTGVPSVSAMPGHVHPVAVDAFVDVVRKSAEIPTSDTAAARRMIADDHSWQARGGVMRRMVDRLTHRGTLHD